jgi:murein DD-endopeptidase MepM/ murein hydrolase activator NlpD
VRWLAWTAISAVFFLAASSTARAAPSHDGAGSDSAPDRSSPETLSTLRAHWPVRGPINSRFGTRTSFWGRHAHTGVDIGARRGTPVHAPAAGTVAFAGWRRGYGRTVVIDHGGQVRSLYGHLSRLEVRSSQRVTAGAEIGRTGTTGNASGPHLHYEVRVKGSPVNPRDRAAR